MSLRQACTECRRRKAGCDRTFPCGRCRADGFKCIPSPSLRLNKSLTRRLSRLEGIVQGATIQTDQASLNTVITLPSVEQHPGDLPSPPADASHSVPNPLFCHVDSLDSHIVTPNPALHVVLCDFFIKFVEPSLKIFHVPVLRDFLYLDRKYLDYDPQSPPCKAIKASLYFVAVSAMPLEDRRRQFGGFAHTMVRRLRNGADVALAEADPTTCSEILTLQALAVYLVGLRYTTNSRRGWTMLALLVRAATGFGLQDEKRSDSAFIREIKRRLWYTIGNLDALFSIDRMSEPLIVPGSYTTPLPSNINDDDISPSSRSVHPRHAQITDMSLSLVTSMWSTDVRRLYMAERSVTGETWMDRLASTRTRMQEIEKTHLCHCDPSIPFHRLVMGLGNLAYTGNLLRSVRPVQGHLSSTPPRVDEQWILGLAVDHLRNSYYLCTDESMKGWTRMPWIPWHSIAVGLASLCSLREGPLATEALFLIEQTMKIFAPLVADGPNGPLWSRKSDSLLLALRCDSLTILLAIKKLYKKVKLIAPDLHPDNESRPPGWVSSWLNRTSVDTGRADGLMDWDWPEFPAEELIDSTDNVFDEQGWLDWQDAVNLLDWQ